MFTSWMNCGPHCARQMADGGYAIVWTVKFADASIVNRMPQGGGGVILGQA